MSILLVVEDDFKTYKEVMMSQDVAFWKEAVNDEIVSYYIIILGLLLICLQIPRWLDFNGFSKENIILMDQFKLLKQG